MPSWWDSLFGDVPMPARPTSRGATLGASFRDMPSSSNIEDRRSKGQDYTVDMQKSRGGFSEDYQPSHMGGLSPWKEDQFFGYDPLVAAPLTATGRKAADKLIVPGAYAPSFPPNLRAPSQPSFPSDFNIPNPSFGPSGLPYLGAHLPWGPGEPGWMPPGLTLNSRGP